MIKEKELKNLIDYSIKTMIEDKREDQAGIIYADTQYYCTDGSFLVKSALIKDFAKRSSFGIEFIKNMYRFYQNLSPVQFNYESLTNELKEQPKEKTVLKLGNNYYNLKLFKKILNCFNGSVEIKENECIYNFEFENTPIETPNTGDISHLRLIAGIMILSTK